MLFESITIRGSKELGAKINPNRFSKASWEYKARLSATHAAEDIELDFVYAKYESTLRQRERQYAQVRREIKKFQKHWDKALAGYDKDEKKLVTTANKMRKNGASHEDVEIYKAEQQKLLDEKHRDVLDAYKHSVEASQPVLDKFTAKWNQNIDYISYQKECAAVQSKYENLRVSLKQMDILEFLAY